MGKTWKEDAKLGGETGKQQTMEYNFMDEVRPEGLSEGRHVYDVRNRTRQAIVSHEDLLTAVKRRKLKWYGHVTRSTGLAKTILQGMVQGWRRRGRQKKRWEDNIPEWTGMTLGAAMRKAERREEWRELVARSSVAPQRSMRLRDR